MRRHTVRFMLLAIACLAAAAPPCAAADHRITVEAQEYPWSAVGRLNVSGVASRSYCTATLIGPQTILTAAHCLWNPVSRTWWRPESVHFVAAYQAGNDSLQSVLTRIVIGDGYQPDGPAPAGNSAADWAIADLAEPLGRQAGWLALANAQEGAKEGAGGQGDWIGELGYRQERQNALSLDYACRFVADFAPASRLVWVDCPAAHGESGGPILVFRPDGPHVVAMTVLEGQRGAVVLTGAVDVATLVDSHRFPVGARAAATAEHHLGHGPPAEGPIGAQPVVTLRGLTMADSPALQLPAPQSPTMATLMQLLATSPISPR